MLSDACHDFLLRFDDAAKALIDATTWYSSPDHTIEYGQKIDPLRRACVEYAKSPDLYEARAELLRAATMVINRLDHAPVADWPVGPTESVEAGRMQTQHPGNL